MSGWNAPPAGTGTTGPRRRPRGRAARAEEVLPARAEAHAAQGIAEEVTPIAAGESRRRVRWSVGAVADRTAGPSDRYERSSIGRAPVSKTGGWGFDSLRSCSSDVSGPRTDRRRSGRPASSARHSGPAARSRPRLQSARRVVHGQSQRWSAGVEATKPAKGGRPGGSQSAGFAPFLANLVRADLYKPIQGWHARL